MSDLDRINIKKINDRVYLMDDAGESTGYLVVGEKKALVIDTMNGIADVKAAARTITGLPLMVVNTHGHGDHIMGNIFFDEAFINPLDREIAEGMSGGKLPPFRDIAGGDVIDLGGVRVEVIALPGHTPGGILLLDREDRILFTGDAINRHLWLQLDHSLPLEDCLKEMEKVLYLTDKADYILHGHAKDVDPISLLTELCDGLKDLCAGKTAGDADYEWFGGKAKLHPFGDGKSAIIYR